MRRNILMNLLTIGLCSMFLLAGCTCTQSQEQKLSFDEPSYTTSPEWAQNTDNFGIEILFTSV